MGIFRDEIVGNFVKVKRIMSKVKYHVKGKVPFNTVLQKDYDANIVQIIKYQRKIKQYCNQDLAPSLSKSFINWISLGWN